MAEGQAGDMAAEQHIQTLLCCCPCLEMRPHSWRLLCRRGLGTDAGAHWPRLGQQQNIPGVGTTGSPCQSSPRRSPFQHKQEPAPGTEQTQGSQAGSPSAPPMGAAVPLPPRCRG